LAPENPFPGKTFSRMIIISSFIKKFQGPLEDCIRVTEYILNNYKTLNLDIDRYMLGGDSAGEMNFLSL
jgi:hypothetical protein